MSLARRPDPDAELPHGGGSGGPVLTAFAGGKSERSAQRSRTLARRLVSLPGVVVAFVVIVPALVVLLPLVVLVDLVARRPFPLARLLLFGVGYLAWEMVAIGLWVSMGIATGFGLARNRPWAIAAHRRVQRRWIRSLISMAERYFGLRLVVTGAEQLAPGPVVLLTRHASILDTILPAIQLFDVGMDVRYVLKRELLADPSLDLIANRIPNYFVDRSGVDTAAEVEAIEQLASGLSPSEAVCIFPEGTRWTPSKRERAIEKLVESSPERVEVARRNRMTMPPRAAGTLAVLSGAPDADVVILSHTGLEGLATLADAISKVPFRHPVRIDLRRIPRSEVPDDDDGRTAWLIEQWTEVNDWVEHHHAPAPEPSKGRRRAGGGRRRVGR